MAVVGNRKEAILEESLQLARIINKCEFVLDNGFIAKPSFIA
jgi:hypothetical protein